MVDRTGSPSPHVQSLTPHLWHDMTIRSGELTPTYIQWYAAPRLSSSATSHPSLVSQTLSMIHEQLHRPILA